MCKPTLEASVAVAALAAVLCSTRPASAQHVSGGPELMETPDGRIVVDGLVFDFWTDFTTSDVFRQKGLRCGTRPPTAGATGRGDVSDCGLGSTNPSAEYDP